MKKIFLGCLVLMMVLLSGLVLGDMMPAGYKSVNYCFIIENQAEYSNYGFMSHGYPMGQWEVIKSGDCVGFYKYSSPIIYAFKIPLDEENIIQKISGIKEKIWHDPEMEKLIDQKTQELITEVKSGKIKLSAEEANRFKPWMVVPVVPNLDDPHYESALHSYAYMKVNEDKFTELSGLKLISSGMTMRNYGLVSEYDPLKSAKDVLKIKALNEGAFVLEKDKVIYTYEDGTQEEFYYQDKNVPINIKTGFPEPSETTIFPPWTNTALFLGGVVISLTALIIIIVILVRRFRK